MADRALRYIGYSAMAVIIAICAVIAIRWALDFIPWSQLDDGWAGVIGSFVGIGIAIFIPWQQHRNTLANDLKKDKEAARRIALAVHDELVMVAGTFAGQNITILTGAPNKTIFPRIIPIPAERFPIYKAIIDRLTHIDSDALRHQIMDTYDHLTSFIYAAEMNNRLLYEYRDIETEMTYRPDELQNSRMDHQVKTLEESGDTMRLLCNKSMVKVADVLTKLDRFIEH